MLNFKKLDVYQRAIEFLAVSFAILKCLPPGNATIADQLRRAALSIPLNIAEANGRATAADAARVYGIARGSAVECAAIIDALLVLELLDGDKHRDGTELLDRVVSMLTRLCR